MKDQIIKWLTVEKLSPKLIAVKGSMEYDRFVSHETSQDNGTVENRIGVIRRFFPKKTDFTKITASQVKRVEKR